MNSKDSYETLDPQDWEKMRSLAHQMVDDSNWEFNSGLINDAPGTAKNVNSAQI